MCLHQNLMLNMYFHLIIDIDYYRISMISKTTSMNLIINGTAAILNKKCIEKK